MRRGGVIVGFALLLSACGASSGPTSPTTTPPHQSADLSALQTLRIDVEGVTFEVWIAQTQAEQRRGLMFVTPEQLAPLPDGTPRGMLFRFPSDRMVGFVMSDTYVPLDLAYIRSDGEIFEIHDLLPLDGAAVSSGQPVRYALEVNAGDLAAHGIDLSDRLALPLAGS